MAKVIPSSTDTKHLKVIRKNVMDFMKHVASKYVFKAGRLLEIGPRDCEGVRPFFPEFVIVESLDINPDSGCTYTGDICKRNDFLFDGSFLYIVCTEVLEHVLNPWDAVDEMWRLLEPGGFLFLSVPFNFRIHGPLPDCWRFTKYGLQALLKAFLILELNEIETPGRPLMPIHYTVVAKKPEIFRDSTLQLR